MGKRSTRVIAVVGAAAVLVVGANAVTYAATGSNLILGKKNKASKVTTVERTKNGPALAIKTKKSSSAPFTTNAKGKVVNLNADKVDGLSASDIRKGTTDVKAIKFKDPAGSRAGNTTYQLGKLPKGVYQVSFNAAVDLTTDGTMTCQLYTSWTFPLVGGHTYAGATTANTGAYNGPSFSTVINVDGTEDFKLGCTTSAGDGWTTSGIIITYSGESPSISFTKLDGITNKSMAP